MVLGKGKGMGDEKLSKGTRGKGGGMREKSCSNDAHYNCSRAKQK